MMNGNEQMRSVDVTRGEEEWKNATTTFQSRTKTVRATPIEPPLPPQSLTVHPKSTPKSTPTRTVAPFEKRSVAASGTVKTRKPRCLR